MTHHSERVLKGLLDALRLHLSHRRGLFFRPFWLLMEHRSTVPMLDSIPHKFKRREESKKTTSTSNSVILATAIRLCVLLMSISIFCSSSEKSSPLCSGNPAIKQIWFRAVLYHKYTLILHTYGGYHHWKKGEGHSQRLWMYRGVQTVCSDSGTYQQQKDSYYV